MTTAPPSPIRPPASPHAPAPRPGMPAGAPGAAVIPLDPVRLLRQYYPFLLVAFIFGAGLGIATHFVWLRVYPIWRSTVVFECSPPVRSLTERDRGTFTQDEMDRFMGTQVQVMKSETILEAAIENRDLLQTDWAKSYIRNGSFQPNDAVIALEEDLSASIIPRTNLIRLTMSGRHQKDVQVIAAAVAQAYERELRNQGSLGTSDRRAALTDQLNKVRTERSAQHGQLKDLLKNNSVDDLDTAKTAAAFKVMTIERQLVEQSNDLSQMRAQLDKMNAQLASGGDIFSDDLIAQATQDPVIFQQDQIIAQLQSEHGALRQRGFGDAHPTVMDLASRIDETRRVREEKLQEKLRELFDSQIEMYRTSVQAMEEQQEQLIQEKEAASLRQQDLLRISQEVKQIQENIARLNESETAIQRAVDELLTIDKLRDAYQVTVRRSAQVPKEVSFPKLKILAPLGAFLLTGLVAGLIVLRELLDQRVKGPADINLIPRLRLLGIVPDAGEDPSRPREVATAFRDTPTGVVTESFRQLRAPLIRTMDGHDHKSLLVMGPMPGSGATAVACNLAMACAAAQERVLLVDANFRRPSMHKIFGTPDAPGLADVLAGEGTLDGAITTDVVENMDVLPVGSAANRALPERLANSAMAKLLAEAAGRYDRIIIDSPPAIVSGDGYALANLVDASVLVVKAMREKRGLVGRVRNQLAESRAEFTGVIVNAVQSSAGGYFKRNIRATHEYAATTD